MEFLLFNKAYQKDLFQALNKTEFTETAWGKKILNNIMVEVVFLIKKKTQKYSFLFFSFLKYKFSVWVQGHYYLSTSLSCTLLMSRVNL